MKLLVETYEVEELTQDAAIMAADSEAAELIERLGLTGQTALLNPDTLTRVPYRKMTAREHSVYSILTPTKVVVENYKDGLIPLRVLQVLEHARSLDFFQGFFIWSPTSADIKDPLLVATRRESNTDELWLLARWGEELCSLDELEVLALSIFKKQATATMNAIQREATLIMETVGGLVALPTKTSMPSLSTWNTFVDKY